VADGRSSGGGRGRAGRGVRRADRPRAAPASVPGTSRRGGRASCSTVRPRPGEAMRLVNPLGPSRGRRARAVCASCSTPGSTGGAIECLEAVLDVVPHALRLLRATQHWRNGAPRSGIRGSSRVPAVIWPFRGRLGTLVAKQNCRRIGPVRSRRHPSRGTGASPDRRSQSEPRPRFGGRRGRSGGTPEPTVTVRMERGWSPPCGPRWPVSCRGPHARSRNRDPARPTPARMPAAPTTTTCAPRWPTPPPRRQVSPGPGSGRS
jgi:hypothetical protein